MGLGISLNQQQALLGTNSAKTLEEQSAKLAMKISADLSVKAEKFAGESRLREAETIKSLVTQIKDLNQNVIDAKRESQQNILRATELLNETTVELQEFLGRNQ